MPLEKISDYFWFQEGPGVRNTQYTTSGVKLLNVRNLVGGRLDLSNTDRYISEEEAYGRYAHFLVEEGDLIIASSGIKVESFNEKIAFASKNVLPLCMNTSTIRFKSLDSNVADIRYFMYFLKSKSFTVQLSKQITGSAQLNFGPYHLKRMYFPLIPIQEQNQIADILTHVDNIRAHINEEILFCDVLIKSQFIEMFGDLNRNTKNLIFVPLTNLFKIGSSKRVYERDWKDSGVPFYRAREIVKLSLDGYVNNDLFISEEMYESYSKKFGVPRPGDIMCTGVGTLGVCYLVKPNDRFYYKDGNIICFHSQNLANSRFILECFNTPFVKNQISSTSSGSTVGTYTIDRARQTLVPLPDRTEQDSFASFVEQIDKSKFRLKQLLEKLDTLYKSLLQKYFG